MISNVFNQCIDKLILAAFGICFNLILSLNIFEGVQWNRIIILKLTSVVFISLDTSLEFVNKLDYLFSFTIATAV